MAKKEVGILSLIVSIIVLLVMGVMLVNQTPKDDSTSSQVVIGIGNSFIWVAMLFLSIIVIIGMIVILKKLGVFDDILESIRQY
jgi:uncharacterized protein YqhQ